MGTAGDGALGDLLVADFSRVLSGPTTSLLLADLGATVIKVESPDGDETRAWGPPYADGESTYFLATNRNKRSIVLDLKSTRGRSLAETLVERADVLVENFRPGTMDRLGLGYEEMAARNPGLIYCSISGFGSGAGASMPGYDFLVQAVGGLMSVTGEADGEPMKIGVALVDYVTGLFATVAVLAALRHRDHTGRGQRVETNLLSSLLAGLSNQSSGYASAGVVPGRMGNAHPSVAPYETVPVSDGTIVLAVGNDRQFAALCDILGCAELSSDPRFATNAARVSNLAEMRAELRARTSLRAGAELVETLMAAGVPAGPVNDLAGAVALAERLGLEPLVEMLRPDGAVVRQVRSPLRLDASPVSYRLAPPRLGEDEEQVIAWLESPQGRIAPR